MLKIDGFSQFAVGLGAPATIDAFAFAPSSVCSIYDESGYSGGGSSPQQFDPVDPKVRVNGVFLPEVYPHPIGFYSSVTTVVTRPKLAMSDIPQMRYEFARIKRDDLLVVNLVDEIHRCAWKKEENDLFKLPEQDQLRLQTAFLKAGFVADDEYSARYLLSRILMFARHRYPVKDIEHVKIPVQLLFAATIGDGFTELPCQGLFGRNACVARLNPEDAHKRIDKKMNARFSVEQKQQVLNALLFAGRIYGEESPTFVRNDKILPPLCILSEGAGINLPDIFLRSPSEFIERQERVSRRELSFADLAYAGYDADKVKRFMLGDVPVITKRIQSLRNSTIEHEINRAQETLSLIANAGIDGVRTVQYLGLIYDAGNFYILMRDEQGRSLSQAPNAAASQKLERLKKILPENPEDDFDVRNAILNNDTLVIYDFDDHVRTLRLDAESGKYFRISDAFLSSVISPQELITASSYFDLTNFSHQLLYRATKLARDVKSGRGGPVNVSIADIHASKRLRGILESPVVQNADKVIFGGDYADRDEDVQSVFKLLRERDPKRNIFIWGNHDLYFLSAMVGLQSGFQAWIGNGGLETVASVMNLNGFDKLYLSAKYAIAPRYPNSPPYFDVFTELEFRAPSASEELQARIRSNPFFQDYFHWLKKQKLFHLDEYGMLYVHAGINLGEVSELNNALNWSNAYRRSLQLAWSSLRSADASYVDHLYQVGANLGRIAPFVEMRENEWIPSPDAISSSQLGALLLSQGLRGIVYGHSRGIEVRNRDDRLFNIDLSMGEFTGSLGGVLRIGPDGISSHRYLSASATDLTEDVLVPEEKFRAMMEQDAPLLLRSMQMYFQERVLEPF